MKRLSLACLALLVTTAVLPPHALTGTTPVRAAAGRDAGPPVAGAPAVPALQDDEPGLFAVQVRGPVTQAMHETMARLGAEVIGPLPPDRFLVRMTPQKARQLSQSDLFLQAERYLPAWKLAPAMAADGIYRIRTLPGEESAVARLVAALGAEAQALSPGHLTAAVVPEESLAALARSEAVLYIEPHTEDELTDAQANRQIQADAPGGAWPRGLQGEGQVIAVTDSGLSTGKMETLHMDLAGRVGQVLAKGRENDWSDLSGHGTHVAGILIGNGAESQGKNKGVAPAAKLIFQSVGRADGSLATDNLYDLFRAARELGASVHSNSYGSPLDSERFRRNSGWDYNEKARAADQFMWEYKDYTIVFSAGNSGKGERKSIRYNSVTSPGTAKNVITVGNATKATVEKPAIINRGSSRGSTIDGRVKPDVVAPGTAICSTRAEAPVMPQASTGACSGPYTPKTGTSMAAPLVAGAAALVRQYYMEEKKLQAPPASLVKATLINGADDLGYGYMSRDQGWGQVNLVDSLYPEGGRQNWFEPEATALRTGDSRVYLFTAAPGDELKVTLVWTDPAAAPSALPKTHLVNDLNLEVIALPAQGSPTVYLGNCFTPSGKTAATACGFDHVNNVENVFLAAPEGGTYAVRVTAPNVTWEKQSYSLVVSGKELRQVSGVVGTVKDQESGVAIAQASVRVKGQETTMATAADGTFGFAATAGSLELEIDHGSYLNVVLETVAVEDGKATARTWTLQRYTPFRTTVSGSVVTQSDEGWNAPVAGAGVTLRNQATGVTATAVTDAAGRYTLAGVAPGVYQVTAGLEEQYIGTSLADLVVNGESTTVPPLRLQPAGLIYGRLFDSSTKQPLPFQVNEFGWATAKVTLTRQGKGRSVYTATVEMKDDGSYSAVVPPGRYLVVASAEHYGKQVTTASVDSQKSVKIENLWFSPVGYVEGRVVNADGKFVRATVAVTSGASRQQVKAKRFGRFFAALPPGTYQLSVDAGGAIAEQRDVTVVAGQTTPPLLLKVQPTSSVSGTVYADAGAVMVTADGGQQVQPAPLAEATVRLVGDGGEKRTTTTRDGRFAFDFLPPGTYKLIAEQSGYRQAGEVTLQVTGGSDVTGTDIHLVRMAAITVTVRDSATGTPFPGVKVLLWSDDARREMTSDADGKAVFRDLNAGGYSLTAEKDGYMAPGVVFLEVGQGETKAFAFTMQRATGTLSGILYYNYSAAPLSYTTVKVEGPGVTRETRSGVDGRFSFAGLPVGTYRVTAYSPSGMFHDTAYATVELGNETSIVLRVYGY